MVMCSRLLRKVPMFQTRDENFINAVLFKLEYEVFLEGDAIVRQNVPGDRMFFIDHGQVLMEADSYERELCDGDFFGGELDPEADRGASGLRRFREPTGCLGVFFPFLYKVSTRSYVNASR